MSTLRFWGCFVLVGALLSVPAAQAQDEGTTPLTLDEEYARLAEEVPGFGGLYLDPEGTTHVYLLDLSRAREVQDLGERVEVHQGLYDFRDLFAWKEEVRPLLSQRGEIARRNGWVTYELQGRLLRARPHRATLRGRGRAGGRSRSARLIYPRTSLPIIRPDSSVAWARRRFSAFRGP